jgi:hypothetical protein
MEVDPTADMPVEWKVFASDARQERLLLDEIIGEVLRTHSDAMVVSQD